MKKAKAIKQFGSVRALAEALGITVQAISQWGENVPALRAYQIKDILNKKQ